MICRKNGMSFRALSAAGGVFAWMTMAALLASPQAAQARQVCDGAAAPEVNAPAKPAPQRPLAQQRVSMPQVPAATLGPVNVAALLAEDAQNPTKCLRVGIQRDISINLASGQWVNVADGRVWVADVVAQGAAAIRLHVSNMNLPDGAELVMYRADNPAEMMGPYVGQGIFNTGEFWTPDISGERVRIECFIPTMKPGHDVDVNNFFRINSLQHLYRDPLGMGAGVDTPTNCADVTCFPAWLDPSHAVARYTYVNGGTFLCSGQLIFAQNGDYTPYFLTANHCLSSNAVANTASFYWLYQTSTCNGAPPALGSVPRSDVATLLSTGAASDYTLLMIEGALPCGLYWYGWDAAAQANGTSGVCISHPGGTWKRIAFGTKQNAFGCGGANHIGMQYTGASGTEPGSSGAAFVLPAGGGRIIGQLHCGPSACETPSNDDYGAFSATYPNISGLLAGGSDDGFGNNHACASAASVSSGVFNNLIVKSTAEDWYKVAVNSGQQLTLTLNFTHAWGDIDVQLLSGCGGSILASSTSTSNTESFTYVNTGASATFYIHAYLYPCDTRNQYNMTVSVATPAPPNNNCGSATPVGLGTYSYTTVGATTDGPSEPALCTNAGDSQVSNDVWFRYTSACTGRTRVSLCNSDYDTKMAVYNASCPAVSSAIACNDDFCGTLGLRSELTFNSVAGNQYLIRIGGYNGATGNGTMVITCDMSDACATAVNVTTGTYPFNSTGATTDGPDEPGLCTFFGYSQVGNDIWYRYTAACTGYARASLCGSTFDTKIAIYDAVCPTSPNSALACNDDFCGPLGVQSDVVFPTIAGFQYLIRIGGYNGETGAGVLRITCPYNDDCSGAVTIVNGSYSYSTIGATTDGPNEPALCSNAGDSQVSNDVWYRYIASCNSTVTVKTCSSNFDTKVAVYNGDTCPSSSAAMVCNDDACGFGTQSRVSFNAVAGNVYRIRIGGYNGAMGSGVLTVTCCMADINGDGTVNVTDLLAVINGWGSCPAPPTGCAADITGDLVVNVSDLLAIINGWGACPP